MLQEQSGQHKLYWGEVIVSFYKINLVRPESNLVYVHLLSFEPSYSWDTEVNMG
jgi:hypothetical protein